MLARFPHPSALAACLFVAACAATACGGGSEGSGGGTGGTTATNSGGTSTGGTAGSGGGTAGSGGGTAGSGGTGAAGGATGGTSTGGTTSSGGSGGGGGSLGPIVACDELSCPVPEQVCCQHYNQPAECLSPDATCTYGVPLACDGPDDCQAGQVCCALINTQGAANAYVSVACAATCTGKDYRVVCGVSGTCPAGKTCGTSDLLPPYLDCK